MNNFKLPTGSVVIVYMPSMRVTNGVKWKQKPFSSSSSSHFARTALG